MNGKGSVIAEATEEEVMENNTPTPERHIEQNNTVIRNQKSIIDSLAHSIPNHTRTHIDKANSTNNEFTMRSLNNGHQGASSNVPQTVQRLNQQKRVDMG